MSESLENSSLLTENQDQATHIVNGKRRMLQVLPLVIGMVIIISLLTIDFTSSVSDGDITGMSVATGMTPKPVPKQCRTDADCNSGELCYDSGAIKVCMKV